MIGGDFPEPAVLIKTAAEAGRVRQTVYPFRLNGRGLVGFLIAWLCLPVIVFLIALGAGAGSLVPALYILVIAALGLAYPFAAIVGARIRICEYGLVVSTLPGKRMRFFIPYTTIDPGSGMVHEPGLVGVAPGMGAIMAAPVSVCHHVSMMGQRSAPITR